MKEPSRLLISFSGGRTSAFMTECILRDNNYDEIQVVFANTGQEHEKTLEFVNNCDKHLNFSTVWVEAEVNKESGQGTRHRVVSFETASRDGRPFEDTIAKYGLPNKASPHCTRELKQNPIRSYARSIGWGPSTYDMAIGIRADEIDRVNANYKKLRIVYPLVDRGVTKSNVLDFWSKQPFDLGIKEHEGNCLWCWKKSDKKLKMLLEANPEWFDFPERMEKDYGMTGSLANKNGIPMVFFRGWRSTLDIKSGLLTEDETNNGCEETCEAVGSEDEIYDN